MKPTNSYNQGTAQVIESETISVEKRLSSILGSRYDEYRKRWSEAQSFLNRPPFPIHIDIELSYSCNLKCIMCPYGKNDYKHPDYYGKKLDKDVLKKTIDEGVNLGLSSIRFSLLNEPLLHSDLPELVEYAKKKGIIDCFITTNGLLLTKQTSEKLIDAGLTHLMISMDASTKKTYEGIRVGSSYEKVVKNIETFLDVRARKEKKLPLLRLSFVRMAVNSHEETDFLKQWADKVDYIAVAGYLNNLGETKQGNRLYTNEKKLYESENSSCNQPWTRCAIFANGDVFPCCLNYGRKMPVGNIHDHSLTDIWQADKTNEIQNDCREGKFYKHSVCLECIRNRELLGE